MTLVGIDVSKLVLDVAVVSEAGEIQHRRFENCTTGHAELSAFLAGFEGCRIALEATGTYHRQLVQALEATQQHVSVVNPAQVSFFVKSQNRRNKTDKADAKKIARYGLDNWAELREYTPMDTIRYELKTLNRQFQLASKNRTACSNNLVALLDQSFPGANRWFDSPVREDGSQKWVDFIVTF